MRFQECRAFTGYTKCAIGICVLSSILGACTTTKIATECIRFKTVKNIPVVEGKINGRLAYFIIDTGASISILNESVAKKFGFRCIHSSDMAVFGLAGQTSMLQAVACEVELANCKITGIRFHTRKLNEIVKVISENERIEIAGIIGANIIDRYGVTINYKNRTISF